MLGCCRWNGLLSTDLDWVIDGHDTLGIVVGMDTG